MRPGLRRAESRMSILLVAMMTLMFWVASNPSNWFSSSSIVRCTSLSPVRGGEEVGGGDGEEVGGGDGEEVGGEGMGR